MKNYIVYIHVCPNNKKYIGITSMKPNRRWVNGLGYKTNEYFTRAINKYGWNNIKHEILYENLTKEEAEQKEIKLIKYYKSNNRNYGYNIESGGHIHCLSDLTKDKLRKIRLGKKLSNESKQKDRIAHLGKKHSEETKKKISEHSARKGKPAWNKEISPKEDVRKKISETLKGVHCSPRTEFKKGHIVSLETKQKIIESHKGKHLSEETKEKIRRANLGYHHTKKAKKKISIAKKDKGQKVICIETKIIYGSIRCAERRTKIRCSSICLCCKGKLKTAGNLHWQYYKEQ